MPIPDALLIDEIKGVPYYGKYQDHVAKYQQHLDAEHGKAAKGGATEYFKATKGPARPVVIREPNFGRIQPLLEVQRKEKEKVIEEQDAHDRFTIQTPKNKSTVHQFIFQRHTPMPAEASKPVESPSLDAELALTDSESEFDDEVPKINTGDQDEGQAGSNAGDAAGSQTQPSYVVPARPNLEPMDLEATDASPLQNPEELDEEFTTTAYPNFNRTSSCHLKIRFTDQFFVKKQREEEPGKTNVEAKVQSMVSVPIHQDSSSVPPMTTLVIDLMTSQSGSPLSTSSATTSTVMTITTTLPPPHQPQQSTADPTLMKRIDELEQQMENLLQYNLALEERLDKHDAVNWIWRKLVRRKEKDVTYQELLLGRHRHNNTSPSSSWCIWCSSEALSSSKSAASAPYSMAWTTSDSRYEYTYPMMKTPGMITYQKLIQEKTSGNHYLKRKDQRHLNLIRPFLLPIDIMNFLNWYCRQVNKTKLTEADLEGQAYEVVKAFYPNVIHLQFQMEEYMEYLRHRSKISSHALSISKMKAVIYPKFGLELLIPEQMWIEDVCTYDISAKIKAYSRYGYDYLSEIFLRRADLQEHMIAEKDFKNLHPSDFEDLNLLLLQGYESKHDYTIIESPRAVMFPVNSTERKIMRFNEIYKFSNGTLTWIWKHWPTESRNSRSSSSIWATEDKKGLSERGMLCR
nr:hypothetical protein [Tanacetum cinerariifolium]